METDSVKIGATYRHFKGGLYRITGFATHTESGQLLVIYKSLTRNNDFNDGVTWARPLDMFCETINGKPRFEEVKE